MNPKEDAKVEGKITPVFLNGVPDPEESLEGWDEVRRKRSIPRPAKKTRGSARQVKKEKAKVINFNAYVCLFEGSIPYYVLVLFFPNATSILS